MRASKSISVIKFHAPTQAALVLLSSVSAAKRSKLEAMALSSGFVALDLVLREHEAIAALPDVVRTIRRFADALSIAKIKHVMRPEVAIEELEQVLEVHCEDMRRDAIVGGLYDEQDFELQRVPYDDGPRYGKRVLRDNVLEYAAKHGSAQVVELSLKIFSGLRLDGVLRLATTFGMLSIVQVILPRETRRVGEVISHATCFGKLNIIKWVHTTYGLPTTHCSEWTVHHAATNGNLDILKWIHASYAE